MKIVVAFRNFANAPKNFRFCSHRVFVFCMGLSPNNDVFFLNSMKQLVSVFEA
jgi:hypothetical protein